VIPKDSPILNACGLKGRNALHQVLMEAPAKYVAENGSQLVKHGADLGALVRAECPAGMTGYTSLMVAVTRPGAEYAEFLGSLSPEDVENGIDVRLCNPQNDFHGFSAIEMAVDEFNQPITEELMRLGADATLAAKRIEEHKETIQSVYHEMFGAEQIPVSLHAWNKKDTAWLFVTTLAFILGVTLMICLYKKKKEASEKQVPEIVVEEHEEPVEEPIKMIRRKVSNL